MELVSFLGDFNEASILEEKDMAMIEFQDVQKYYGDFHASRTLI